jgi:3-oxoacyl-[acyl-carrier protein] reductase
MRSRALRNCPAQCLPNVIAVKDENKTQGENAMTLTTKTAVNRSPILHGKNAVVFGAGGSIGAAVAREFAGEGAEVFLAGRTKANLDEAAGQIIAAGGNARTTIVDVLDDAAVNEYIEGILKQTGKIDILLDAAGPLAREYGNGKIATELPIEEFMLPLTTMVKSRFITARAAARHMVTRRSGVIIFVTGSPARAHVPGATALARRSAPLRRSVRILPLN